MANETENTKTRVYEIRNHPEYGVISAPNIVVAAEFLFSQLPELDEPDFDEICDAFDARQWLKLVH